jgi:hypothetical protein
MRVICGNIWLAEQWGSKLPKNAAGEWVGRNGRTLSPVFASVVAAEPSHPVFIFDDLYGSRYSAHLLDLHGAVCLSAVCLPACLSPILSLATNHPTPRQPRTRQGRCSRMLSDPHACLQSIQQRVTEFMVSAQGCYRTPPVTMNPAAGGRVHGSCARMLSDPPPPPVTMNPARM